jgi:glyoxylase-like metal-dependent hydrolase (beta-lactamase superfamily II)
MVALTAPVRLFDSLYIVYSEYPHVDCGNVYLTTGATPTLIDCGSPRGVDRLVLNLAQLGLDVADVVQVIATHGDYDHIQGFHRLRALNPELRLYLHRQDWPIVQGNDAYSNSSDLYQQPFVPFLANDCLPLDDGAAIPAGDGTLTVHHTPGHTAGSICLLGHFGDESVLFAGDAIGGGVKGLEGATLAIWAQAVQTWRESLQSLLAADFQWALNGHEPARSLPLPRAHVERLVKSFGKMLNPWFTLAEDEPVITLITEPATAELETVNSITS